MTNNSQDSPSDAAIHVLISQVSDMREDVRDLRTDIKGLADDKVSYREWSQRNNEVNGRFSSQGREIGDLRTEIRAKSAPWWSVGALLVAASSFAWSIFRPV